MGRSKADVFRCHPRLFSAAVQLVAVQGNVCGQHEAISVVCCDGHLTLSDRQRSSTGHDVHFFAVGNRLAALDRPDRESFVGVDVGGDRAQVQGCHLMRPLETFVPQSVSAPLRSKRSKVGP